MKRSKGSGSIKDTVEAGKQAERDAAEVVTAREEAALTVDPEFPPEAGDEPLPPQLAATALSDPAPQGLDAFGTLEGSLEIVLPRPLSQDERSKRFGLVGLATHELNVIQGEAKASAFKFRDMIKGKEADIAGLLAETINEPVRCEIRIDWVGNARRVIRLDSREVVETRALTAADRQLAAFPPRPVLVNEEPAADLPENVLPFGSAPLADEAGDNDAFQEALDSNPWEDTDPGDEPGDEPSDEE